MPDPFRPGVNALERFSRRQQKKVGQPSKDEWARTHLRELVEFWRNWNRSQLGAIEDVIAVSARRKSLPFDPVLGTTVVFVRIILGFDRRKASTWAKVIDAVIDGRKTLAQVATKGIAVSAYGKRKTKPTRPVAAKKRITITRKTGRKTGSPLVKKKTPLLTENEDFSDWEEDPFDADD